MQKLLTIDEKSYSYKRYKQDNNMTKLWNYIKKGQNLVDIICFVMQTCIYMD